MRKFFTLIELVVVIAVLGILAAIIIPNISSFQEEANDTAIQSNVRNLQTSVDMYAMENFNVVPTVEQPTTNVPQPIDFGQIYPDYTRDLPETEGVKYWVDFNGKVWASTIDAPTGVTYDTTNLKWNGVENAAYYNVFKTTSEVTSNVNKKKMLFIKKVEDSGVEISISMPSLKTGEEYLVNAVDKNEFQSAPAGTGYTGFDNNVPIAVIGMTPDTNLKSTTSITWSYSGSTDPDGDAISKAEWLVNDNPVTSPPTTFDSGSHTVKLRVQDERGKWSSWKTKSFTVQADALIPIGTGFIFTNAGATGRYGPSQTQINSAYNNTNLQGKVTSSNGVQEWIVPETGTYRIETLGAAGGGDSSNIAGRGAKMIGEFNLNQGETLQILVGQKGEMAYSSSSHGGGGGGGTFVAKGTSYSIATPIIVAGGGGGGKSSLTSSKDAITATHSTTTGSAGHGGSSSYSGIQGSGSAGGFYSDGTSVYSTRSGQGFRQGGNGGTYSPRDSRVYSGTGHGGFGGGASVGSDNVVRNGPGGGYSGGNGSGGYYGYGGASYNAGSNQSNSSGVNTGHGKVTITRIN